MLYFDTSFLVPLVIPEATSDKIAKFIRALPAQALTVSHWTRVEFSALLGREVRGGGLNAEAARRADARFEVMLDESFAILLPNAGDFDLARKYLGNPATGLGAGAALHLAIGKNRRAKAIYSLDRTLLEAGKLLGLPVRAGIRIAG